MCFTDGCIGDEENTSHCGTQTCVFHGPRTQLQPTLVVVGLSKCDTPPVWPDPLTTSGRLCLCGVMSRARMSGGVMAVSVEGRGLSCRKWKLIFCRHKMPAEISAFGLRRKLFGFKVIQDSISFELSGSPQKTLEPYDAFFAKETG